MPDTPDTVCDREGGGGCAGLPPDLSLPLRRRSYLYQYMSGMSGSAREWLDSCRADVGQMSGRISAICDSPSTTVELSVFKLNRGYVLASGTVWQRFDACAARGTRR